MNSVQSGRINCKTENYSNKPKQENGLTEEYVDKLLDINLDLFEGIMTEREKLRDWLKKKDIISFHVELSPNAANIYRDLNTINKLSEEGKLDDFQDHLELEKYEINGLK